MWVKEYLFYTSYFYISLGFVLNNSPNLCLNYDFGEFVRLSGSWAYNLTHGFYVNLFGVTSKIHDF